MNRGSGSAEVQLPLAIATATAEGEMMMVRPHSVVFSGASFGSTSVTYMFCPLSSQFLAQELEIGDHVALAILYGSVGKCQII